MWRLYLSLYFFTLTMGTMIAITANSWLITWLGLEVNLLGLMPLMSNLNKKYSSEATIKYFLIQVMASGLFLFSSIIMSTKFMFNSMEINTINSFLMCTALLLKIGAAPFHFWLPEVISGSDWKINFMILTWQKLAPMIVIYQTMQNPLYFSIIIIISSIISGIQGMNQTCLRKIMAYSSINHSSWMIASILSSLTLWFCYYMIYLLINTSIMMMMNKSNIYNISQLSKFFTMNKMKKIMFLFSFLNLGGLPPFLGFLPKWMVTLNLVQNNFFYLTTLLIIFTLITLYFYIRICLSTFTINSEESLTNFFVKMNYLSTMISIFSLISLSLCSMLTNHL
uniref:NADH-ubiquinone oxidoreductase chain 2 n=1 Tax=Ceutorhynchus obstrictus TaxID=307131 RepID=A0A5J6KKJ5_9CUCU|nr:NADH dehydrogenase subunit 2 [Ceutorhynchus obstrictus]QEV84347.1 NADH dehydrogenase subunit 2 [Ceutorhynchus obstrictus]